MSSPSSQSQRTPLSRHFRTMFLLAAVLTALLLSPADSRAAQIAFYPFSGNVNDASGNGHNGTVTVATLAADRFGKAASAYSFSGIRATPDYIEIPDSAAFNFAWHAFTISAWIRIDGAFEGDAGYGAIFDRIGPAGGYRLDYSTSQNRIRLLGNRISLEVPANLTPGVWYHVAAISDGSYSKIYLNGDLIITGGHWVDADQPTAPRIGSLVNGSASSAPFKGRIDELFVYDYVLSATEVVSHYNSYTVTASATNGTATPAAQAVNYGGLPATIAGTANAGYYFTGVSGCGGTPQTNSNQAITSFSYTTGPLYADCSVRATCAPIVPETTAAALPVKGLVARYPFNGSANDATGFAHHGVVTGGVLSAVDHFGNQDGAYRFDGSTGYVKVDGLPASAELTAVVSAKSGTPVWNENGVLLSARNGNGFLIHPEKGGTAWSAYLVQNNGTPMFIGKHTPASIDDAFHQYAITYDTASGQGRMFFDAQEVMSTSIPAGVRGSSSVNLYIANDSLMAGRFGDVLIEDVLIYSRALSQAELSGIVVNPFVEPRVSVGDYHSCAITPDGKVTCFGSNNYAQSTPPAGMFQQVSCGSNHTCGVRPDGVIVCWGRNDAGQSLPPAGTFLEVASGGRNSCGVRTDGTVTCWGSDLSPPPTVTVKQISGGGTYCALTTADGSAACWGPADPPPGGSFLQLSQGVIHGCGVRPDKRVSCWGEHSYLLPRHTLSPPVFDHFQQVSVGDEHACGVRADGTVECWGNDDSHQVSHTWPGTFAQVGAGYTSSCGIKTDGTGICWGGLVSHMYVLNEAVLSAQPNMDASTPAGTVGAWYATSIWVADGWSPNPDYPPYTFSIVAGSLPPGLSMASDGYISGTPVKPGDYTFTVRTFDATRFQGTAVTFTISVRHATATSIVQTAGANPSSYGDPVTFTATVSTTPSGATGSVTFLDSSVPICTAVPLSGVTATCSTAWLSGGVRTVVASYSGDAEYRGSSGSVSHTVSRIASSVAISGISPESMFVGQPYTVSFAVTSAIGTPTGTVTVSDTAGNTCSAAVSAGSCQLTSWSPGSTTISVSYSGDINFDSSSSTGTLYTVDSPSLQVFKFGGPANSIVADGCTLVWHDNLGVCNVPDGTSITLSAKTVPASSFAGWQNGSGPASSCTGTGNCAFIAAGSAVVQADFNGMLAWYPLDGNFYDYSGNGNHGPQVGGYFHDFAPDRTGLTFGASDFNDISIPSTSSLDLAGHPFTITAWVQDSVDSIFMRFDPATGSGFGLSFENWGHQSQAVFTLHGSKSLQYTRPMLDGTTWHHIAAVSDGSGNGRIYFDGVLVMAGPYQNALNNNGPASVGYGSIVDDVRVYNNALSAAEITELFTPSKQMTVKSGDANACVKKGDGSVFCWGSFSWGECTPAGPVAGTFTQVASGWTHACGIKTDGTVACWGDNTHGQASPPTGHFTRLAANLFTTCGLKNDGSVVCWGDFNGSYGSPYGVYSDPSDQFTSIEAFYTLMCGVRRDGSVFCWDDTSWPEYTGERSLQPGPYLQALPSNNGFYALKADGSVVGEQWSESYPIMAPPSEVFTQISVGEDHGVCGLTSDGRLLCWESETPGDPRDRYTSIAGVDTSGCGLRIDGTVVCWGMAGYVTPKVTMTSPAVFPDGAAGRSYAQAIGATTERNWSCDSVITTPYVFSLTEGDLPPGLFLSADGIVSGVPETIGTYQFTVRVIDANGIFGESRDFTLTIKPVTHMVNVAIAGSGIGSVTATGCTLNWTDSLHASCTAVETTAVTLTATAAAGSNVSWSCTGGTGSGNGSDAATCSYSSLDGDKTAQAAFELLPQYTVTASAGEGGSISPSGGSVVTEGDPVAFTVTPDANYLVVAVSGCSGSLVGNTYTTAPITVDCAVDATFTEMLDLSMLGDGAITNDAVLNISGIAAAGLAVTINDDPVALSADGSFSAVMPLADGANPVTVVATGTGGVSSTFSRTITLYAAAPELTVSTPADNSATNLASIGVSGTVPAGATLVELEVNGAAPQVLPIDNGSFSGIAALEEGLNTLALAVTADGKTSHAKRSVTRVAPSKPSLAITSPGQDALIEAGNVAIAGAVADVAPERIVMLSLTVDGKSYQPVLTSGAFSQTVPLETEGLSVVTVTATDDQGNVSSVTRNLVVQFVDNDGDGLPNHWEVKYSLNPNDATGVNGASGDPDKDTFSNLTEYTNVTNPRIYTTAIKPTWIEVPASSNGSIRVYWGTSGTPGATFIVEESYNSGPYVQVYSGSGRDITLTNRANGSYAYRVKVIKDGWHPSAYTTGTVTCVVSIVTVPPPKATAVGPTWIYVPASSTTGSIRVYWGTAGTAGSTFVTEESLNGGAYAQVYSGTLRDITLTNRANGSYTYRVRVVKDGMNPSPYASGTQPCVVNRP